MLTANELAECADRRRPGRLKGASLTYLLSHAQDGSEAAWAELLDRFANLVRCRIRRAGVTGAEADDAFQLTWLKLATSLESIRDPERMAGWLAVTARNEAVNLIRREQRFVPSDRLDHQISADADDDRPYVGDDVAAAVTTAVMSLNDRQRAVVQLRYLGEEPESYREIAAKLEMRHGAIGPTLGRALDRLRGHPLIGSLR